MTYYLVSSRDLTNDVNYYLDDSHEKFAVHEKKGRFKKFNQAEKIKRLIYIVSLICARTHFHAILMHYLQLDVELKSAYFV